MNSTAIEIAKKLNGRVEGNGQVQLNKLSKIEEWEMKNYKFYTKQLVENYRYHYQNNMTVKDRLEYINS